MNYLEAIEPHNDRLDHYKKSRNFGGDVTQLRKLAEIYMEYIYQGKGDTKPNLGCGICNGKMMDRHLVHRDMCRNTNGGEVVTEYTEEEYESIEVPAYQDLKMSELKSMASKQGMNTYRKTKVQIIEWLKENS